MIGLLPRRVMPILMYHRIGSTTADDSKLFVSEEGFRGHLRWLREHGFESLSVAGAVELWSHRRVPKRSVLITFDDAFADTLEAAARALEESGMRATVFAPAAMLDEQVELGAPAGGGDRGSSGRIASATELRSWLDKGFDIGSHSLTHVDLAGESATRVLSEMLDSKDRLEQLLEHPIEDFCYPYTHHNAICRRLAQRCGYRSAFAGEPPRHDLYAIPRMMVYPRDTLERFRRKVSGYYYWISAWHRRIAGATGKRT